MGSLLEIVGLEPDPSIAMSVVLRMVERVPEAERILWAEKITAERKRSLAVLRVRELRILEAVSGEAGVHGQPASCQIAEWSDWLQLRAAERSTSVSVLERLGESGLTRRVRHLSAERLRALRRAPK
ncbi:hypothetical protein [Streptomyces torulosus]|uniref:hypothetical protein n=1 Tax=Streptomyces torulosus TaxID=68276 RepID=UPI000A7EBB80|nr:hypothetical protein [Streptomyces torulosus]